MTDKKETDWKKLPKEEAIKFIMNDLKCNESMAIFIYNNEVNNAYKENLKKGILID